MPSANAIQRTTSFLRAGMFLLAAIGIAMVIRRILAIKGVLPSFSPPGRAPFDTTFALHPVFTLLHIIPGAIFMIVGTMQFLPAIQRTPRFYHWNSALFLFTGYIVGLTALALPFVLRPIGGINEAAASLTFDIYFLVALSMTWRHTRKDQPGLQREWQIRAFAIALAVATIRPIIALFFIFSHQQPEVFFGTAFWLGFTLHAIIAEIWIDSTRPKAGKMYF